MRKKADSVNIWSRYLKGTPAQEIYTRYKKALSEESRAMQFSQKITTGQLMYLKMLK